MLILAYIAAIYAAGTAIAAYLTGAAITDIAGTAAILYASWFALFILVDAVMQRVAKRLTTSLDNHPLGRRG